MQAYVSYEQDRTSGDKRVSVRSSSWLICRLHCRLCNRRIPEINNKFTEDNRTPENIHFKWLKSRAHTKKIFIPELSWILNRSNGTNLVSWFLWSSYVSKMVRSSRRKWSWITNTCTTQTMKGAIWCLVHRDRRWTYLRRWPSSVLTIMLFLWN